MVGGRVIGLVRRKDGTTMLHVEDERTKERVCVDVLEHRSVDHRKVEIMTGDSVWWQSVDVMWTPRSSRKKRPGEDFDIRIPKIGHTHHASNRPAWEAP